MILKDFIKHSGADLVYITDTKRGYGKRGCVYTYDLTYPPDTMALKEFLEDYGHSEVLYGVVVKSTSTVTAQI